MTQFRSEFLKILSERGFIHQTSDDQGLDALLASQVASCYIGFDCTASSLHVGSLVQIMMLHWFQQCGHRPVVLMGGGTTMVGDPSGKDESRQLLTVEDIENNKVGIRKIFSQFLQFGSGQHDAIMADNAEWLMDLNYVSFLRDIGRHISVNQMLARDSVKLRLDREQHLSFLEFNYMLLQAYDYVELSKRYNCRLQMGGSDQWGNIVSGVDLGRRMGTPQLFALTAPLLSTSSGAKMGKTASGAVWLSADKLSPWEYWQYWRNCEDGDVERFLKLFTTLSLDEVAKFSSLQGAELNEAKKILANEATAMVHGRRAAETAAETARQTFEKGTMSENLPSVEMARSEFEDGVGILSALVAAGLASSNGDARRHVKGGAVRLNDEAITDDRFKIKPSDFGSKTALKLSVGKKRHVLIQMV